MKIVCGYFLTCLSKLRGFLKSEHRLKTVNLYFNNIFGHISAIIKLKTLKIFLHSHIYVSNEISVLFMDCIAFYKGISKSFETSSIDLQPTAVREWVRCAWEQGTSPLSMTSGVAVWTLGVAQHECLSPRVSSHLLFQHGRESGAESKHQILCETRQIWSGDFSNDTCVWKRDHESCEVFRMARALQ